jgi:hypothetical protein
MPPDPAGTVAKSWFPIDFAAASKLNQEIMSYKAGAIRHATTH